MRTFIYACTMTTDMLVMPPPASILGLLAIAPVLIAYLAHVPDTKPLRLGVWLVGLTAYVWTVLGVDLKPGQSFSWSDVRLIAANNLRVLDLSVS